MNFLCTAKDFQYEDENVCDTLFTLACQCGCVGMLRFLMEQHKAEKRYAKLGSYSLDILKTIKDVPSGSLSSDDLVRLYFSAATTDDHEKKLDLLFLLVRERMITIQFLLQNPLRAHKNNQLFLSYWHLTVKKSRFFQKRDLFISSFSYNPNTFFFAAANSSSVRMPSSSICFSFIISPDVELYSSSGRSMLSSLLM